MRLMLNGWLPAVSAIVGVKELNVFLLKGFDKNVWTHLWAEMFSDKTLLCFPELHKVLCANADANAQVAITAVTV